MTGFEGILLALLLVMPWGEGGAAPGALALVHTAVFGAALAILWRSFRRGDLEFRSPWALAAYLPFLAAGGAGMLRADYLFGSFDTYWDQWIALILGLALCCASPTERFARAAAACVVAIGAAQAIPAIASRITEGAAISPSFLNANHLAAYLNVAVFVAVDRAGWLRWSRRAPVPDTGLPGASSSDAGALTWGAGAIVCAAGTIAVASRGALLALIVTLLLALAGRSTGRARRRLLALPLLAGIAVLAIVSVQGRFRSVEDPYRYDRPRLWTAALAAWREAPLLGLGPGMYEHRSVRHNFPQEAAVFRYSKEPHSAHSQPLQTLAEEGVIGLAALLLFAGVAARGLASASGEAGERGRAARAGLLALTATGIHALFETPFETPAMTLTLVILAWPALAPARREDAAAAFLLRWPSGSGGSMARWSVAAGAGASVMVLYALGVAAPYLAYACVRYAESPRLSAERADLLLRAAGRLNPYQAFLGYRRARAAVAASPRISPSLFATSLESLERTMRMEPGDPSAYALAARLYARAAADLPGAGPGALAAAERGYGEAIRRAPLDARLLVERAAFRLAGGASAAALSDCREALALEPRALTAHLLRVEALLAAGNLEDAATAFREMDSAAASLRGYRPLNGYEEALLRVDPRAMEDLRRRLGSLLLVVPARHLLGGGN